MKRKPIVLFNASTVIAGLYSPSGGSGKLLKWTKKKKIIGVISEIIFNEIIRHVQNKNIQGIFKIVKAPARSVVNSYMSIVVDEGDAHVLATASEIKADFLVTLDKKHLLILKNRMKGFKILSPKELILSFTSEV